MSSGFQHDAFQGDAFQQGALVAAASDRTGTLSVSLDDVALSSTGAVSLKAALSATLSNLSLSSAGALSLAGVSSVTLGDVTLAATGRVAIAGGVAATLSDAALSATGRVAISATLAAVLDNVSGALTGASDIDGQSTVTLDGLSFAATGTLAIRGDLSATLDALGLVAAGSGGVEPITGSLAITLDDVVALATAQSGQLRGRLVRRLRGWRRRQELTADNDDPNDYKKFEAARQDQLAPAGDVTHAPVVIPARMTSGFLSRLAGLSESYQVGVMLQLTNEALISDNKAKIERLNSALAALNVERFAKRLQKERRQQELAAFQRELIARAQQLRAEEDEEETLLLLAA